MPLSDYDPIFQSAAQEWNLDPNLLKAIAAQESSGNPRAVSRANAQGLMQIIPETQKYLGITDPNDPVQSIYGGAKYLSEGLDKEGSPEKALLFYHGGPDWRQKYGPESAGYVPAVTAHYKKFSAPQGDAPAPQQATSDADFLKATGGGSSQTTEDDASFLARTGGKAAPAPTPNPDAGLNEYGITGDPQQFNGPQKGVEVATPVANVASEALAGAKQGFGTGPLGLSPQSEDAMARAGIYNGPGEYNPLKGINKAVINPLAAGADLVLRGGGALLGAYQHGIAQAGQEIGQPALGRDLAALPEAFPTGDTTGGTRLVAPSAAAPVETPAPRFVSEAFAPAAVPGQTKLDRITQLIAHDNAEAAGVRNEVQPNALAAKSETPLAAPAPNSVGAAASASTETGMTPAQELAYRSTAEGQKLLEPQPIGVEDRSLYVHGSNPNAAEIEQSVNTARELKSLNVTAPEVSQEAKEIAAENNEARTQHFAMTAGSDVDVLNAKEARAAQAEKDLASTWADKKPADAQPLLDAAAQIKASPDGKRPVVRNAVDAVTKELYDADGNLETDPEQLYGVRKHVDDLMSKEAGADDPKSVRAMANLRVLKETLDGVIEDAAPGFGDYLQNFSDASKRIDEMDVLQKHEPKLFDAQNRMTYNKVQTMMRQIVDSRQAPGINPYKSITDDTMQRLWALRDDLRRSASAQELARTAGSDTAQNAWDAAKSIGKIGAEAGAHVVANALSPGFGSVGLAIGQRALHPLLSARSAKRQTARGMEILRPKTELHNPLASP